MRRWWLAVLPLLLGAADYPPPQTMHQTGAAQWFDGLVLQDQDGQRSVMITPFRERGQMPPDQLPASIPPGALTTTTDTYIVPALIARAGDQAGWRYIEFFTANIRNPNTRRAYARACAQFFTWCEDHRLTLTTIGSIHVATWVEQLQKKHGAPGVKQQLAAVRMLFDWLITGQVVPINPAAAVRGPKHVVKIGKTPVLDAAEWRKLIDNIPTNPVRDPRDRALIATLTYSFARIGAALKMKVEDLQPKGSAWRLRLHEKGGRYHEMPMRPQHDWATVVAKLNKGGGSWRTEP
jgi:Phage integrase, N-terminal SAM-like domain